MHTPYRRNTFLGGALVAALAALLGFALFSAPGRSPAAATQAVTAPPPPGREQATFAAGCFWSMEAIFKQLRGVDKVEPGYAGGRVPHPSYELVETGRTGYAETINITYNPKVISYRDLLRVLLTVRNPTTLNQQGPDVGTQYRSVIFYRSPAQKQAADAMIKQIGVEHVWNQPIVTTTAPFTSFYRAEDYHLNYYNLHPDEGYCRYVIAPEIDEFHAKFKSLLKP